MLSEPDAQRPTLKSVLIERDETGNCGFHLTRSKWDPYPWVTTVDPGSSAEKSGLKNGDCLLEVNGEDVLGQKITDIAGLVKKSSNVTLFLWNSGVDDLCSPETICCGPMPRNFQKLSACTSSILGFLECPICLDTIAPPCYQCDNGHLICIRCRAKTERCPICRNRLNRGRSLLADQIYNVITEIFELKETPENIRNTKIQKIFKVPQKKEVPDIKVTHAHTSKFLARLVGKSSSVDNLSSNNNNSNLNLGDNLKAKSLSSTELFINGSPVVSRSNSMKKLSKTNRLGCSTSTSCYNSCHNSRHNSCQNSRYNSYESLNMIETENFKCCPFENNCSTLINPSDLISHFQKQHKGPLIQYFNPSFKLSLKNLDENNTYVINYNNNLFFIKILRKTNNFHIWSWKADSSNNFYMMCKILNKNNDPLLTISLPICVLNQQSWREIQEMKQGIILNENISEVFNINEVILEVFIKLNDCT